MITSIVANLLPWGLQAAGVVATAAVLPWLFRLDVAGVRYAYWRAVAVLCLALPWIQPYTQTRTVATSVATDVAVASSQAQSAVATTRADWGAIVVLVLAAGALLRLIWLGFGLVRLQRLRRAALTQPPVLIDPDLQPALGTRANIRYARDLQQPVTFGIRKPLVLLPDVMRSQPPEIQRAVIGHELLHVKRRDWAWLIVEEIAVCLFWFHPASWWVASRIQCAREEVVDELAILLTGRRRTYVEALLAFADTTSVVPTAAFARRRHLLRRIALVSKEDVMSPRRIVATCAAMMMIVGLGSWYAVSAFPLHGTDQTATAASFEAGPLELRAHVVTPENPVPRRVHYEPVTIPDSIDSIRGNFGVRVTLDDVGRVAEARYVKMEVSIPGRSLEESAVDLGNRGTRLLENGADAEDRFDSVERRRALKALFESVIASVRQWQYAPPFEAPLTFTVNVPFAKGPEVMAFKPRQEGDALRVGGNINPPVKTKDVKPVYPPIARDAGIAGVVIIEVRIGTDGRVEEAHVLKSIPLLDEAALDAVKQWQFVPTLLNGAPVPIMMTVTINFAQD